MTALVPISGMAACAPPLAGPDRWAVAAPEAVGLDLNRLCALVPWIEGSRESDSLQVCFPLTLDVRQLQFVLPGEVVERNVRQFMT